MALTPITSVSKLEDLLQLLRTYGVHRYQGVLNGQSVEVEFAESALPAHAPWAGQLVPKEGSR
jgi:hypothetical protein